MILRVLNVSQKHPHMRGEDIDNAFSTAFEEETPPHAWGRPEGPELREARIRNTPTCVGKTTFKREYLFNGDETPPHAWGRLNPPKKF